MPAIVTTASGNGVDLERPSVIDIELRDIAVSLSHLNRFTGHTDYSVGEHSIALSEFFDPEGPDWALAALFHDAHEAYTGDISAPLKSLLGPRIRKIEERLDAAIARKLGLPLKLMHDPRMKEADRAIANVERAWYLPDAKHWPKSYDPVELFGRQMPKPRYGRSPTVVRAQFIGRYKDLAAELYRRSVRPKAS